jgi:ornithine cyclodeaminase/alanine dehydrogenase-like protein (mu-crystallin family)
MLRRKFIAQTGLTAAAMTVLPSINTYAETKAEKVRLAIIGTGLRGQNHLDLILRRADTELVAICDINDKMLEAAKAMIAKSGKSMPQVFTGDSYAWKKMITKHQLDGIIIATPWEWHNDYRIYSSRYQICRL